MKILFLSNLYPPHFIGGYEQLCYDVVNGLRKRNHDIHVLTSTYGVNRPIVADGIYRVLRLRGDIYSSQKKRLFRLLIETYLNIKNVRKTIRAVKPDIIYIWNMGGLPKIILDEIQRFNIPIIYHLSDYWLIHQEGEGTFLKNKFFKKRLIKNVLGFLLHKAKIIDWKLPEIKHASCSCSALKRELIKRSLLSKNAMVIYEGIPLDIFPKRDFDKFDFNRQEIHLIYAGQLSQHKGLHTVILALSKLINERDYKNIHFSIVGRAVPGYLSYIKSLIDHNNLIDYVTFYEPVSREKLGSIFSEQDLFVFPSIWEEPWSLILLIAMACGLAVVSTQTGGSKEILRDGDNCLTFTAGDKDNLANQIEKLITSSELRKKVSMNAQSQVRENFGIEKMVDKIEQLLNPVIN